MISSLSQSRPATGGHVRATYIGGPTRLLEVGGVRFLTDPTFDDAGSTYPTAVYTLRKQAGPALSAADIGHVDCVLLSHDHHFDNLDRAGRALLDSALGGRDSVVLTTPAGAARLGPSAVGLAPWQGVTVSAADGRSVSATGTPARHGPEGGDRGPVTGFIIAPDAGSGGAAPTVYVSGDTVWYDGVAEVARRYVVDVAVLFLGAARVREVGPAHLTMTAEEGVTAARALGDALIVPVHFDGWAHFSEGRAEIARAFDAAGLTHRLRWLAPGTPVELR